MFHCLVVTVQQIASWVRGGNGVRKEKDKAFDESTHIDKKRLFFFDI